MRTNTTTVSNSSATTTPKAATAYKSRANSNKRPSLTNLTNLNSSMTSVKATSTKNKGMTTTTSTSIKGVFARLTNPMPVTRASLGCTEVLDAADSNPFIKSNFKSALDTTQNLME